MRRARVDSNQKEIVGALRNIGALVAHTHTIGKGFPDIVTKFQGKIFLLEIKASRKKKLTPDEKEFAAIWEPAVVTDIESALIAVGAIK